MVIAKIERRFALVSESVTGARGLVDELGDRLDPRLVDDLRVVVSELFTNAYKHSGLGSEDRARVRLEVFSDECVRGEVEDGGPGSEVPPLLRPAPDGLGGRGLYLLDHLVERWGGRDGGRRNVRVVRDGR